MTSEDDFEIDVDPVEDSIDASQRTIRRVVRLASEIGPHVAVESAFRITLKTKEGESRLCLQIIYNRRDTDHQMVPLWLMEWAHSNDLTLRHSMTTSAGPVAMFTPIEETSLSN